MSKRKAGEKGVTKPKTAPFQVDISTRKLRMTIRLDITTDPTAEVIAHGLREAANIIEAMFKVGEPAS
jgi:hypothetical protein